MENRTRKKILLVDDVLLFLHLQISFLGRDNYDIHIATSGQEGLAKAIAILPDLILLDFVMPDINGSEVCRRLKTDPRTKHIPIVIISSRSGEEETAAIKASGCNGLLYKPVRREVLICTVEDQLNEPRRRCQRIRVSVPCSAKGPHGNLVGTIESISTLGMLLVMDQALLPGEILNFEFALPDNATPLNLSGNVVWVGRCTKGSNMRAGVEFINPKVNERERLYDFVKWHNHPAAFRNDPRPGMENEAPP